jgi:hypothetical protein
LAALPSAINHPVQEADHSHPSCAKVKNEWSYTPLPPCLHGMDRNNLHEKYDYIKTHNLTFKQPVFTYAITSKKPPLKSDFIYLGKKEIYCIF